MQFLDTLTRFLRISVLALGVWAMYAQGAVFLKWNFEHLLQRVWIPALVVVLFVFLRRRFFPAEPVAKLQEDPVRLPQQRSFWILLFFTLAVLASLRPGHVMSGALYLLAIAIFLIRIGDRPFQTVIPPVEKSTSREWPILLLVIFFAMIISLCEHRVNWDDAKYLHLVANTLEYPHEPLLVYDHLHGVEGLKIYHPSVQLQTYELLVATLSQTFRINHLQMYYLILPPVWAALSVIAQWSLIRRIASDYAAWGVLATFVVLAVWGGHRSYGAFSFDYVGRGIFLTFALPVLIYGTLDFAKNRTFDSWLSLFFAAWMGCLFTSTAYAVVPVAVFLVLTASFGLDRKRFAAYAMGGLAVLWCPVLLAYATWVDPLVPPVDVDTPGNVHTIFKGVQGRVALLLFAVAPFLLWIAGLYRASQWLLRYTLVCFVLLFSGIFLHWVGSFSSVLSWRLLWAVPVPAIIGIGLAAASAFLYQHVSFFQSRRIFANITIVTAIVLIFVISGGTVVFRNFGWPVVKMDKTVYPVARVLVECSSPNDLVLTESAVAVPAAGMIGAPSFVAVRGHHLAYLSAQWGSNETERRKRLFQIAQGIKRSKEDILWARSQLASGEMKRIVLKADEIALDSFRNMLRDSGMRAIDLQKWELWLPQADLSSFKSCIERQQALVALRD